MLPPLVVRLTVLPKTEKVLLVLLILPVLLVVAARFTVVKPVACPTLPVKLIEPADALNMAPAVIVVGIVSVPVLLKL